MFKLFSLSKPSIPPIEKWAEANKNKASADGIIAATIVESFAKDYKSWKFEGAFEQRYSSKSSFQRTVLSRKVPCKKHIEIVFIFRETNKSDAYSNLYKYKVIGCEVNGIQLEDKAFRYILTNWNSLVVQVKATEAAAAEALANQQALDAKWNLAEELLGKKRNKQGALVSNDTPLTAMEG
jgi:hypothetical protein